MKFITENSKNWKGIITEELGVKNPVKLNWMSKYAQIHEIFEGVNDATVNTGVNAYPLNTLGIGNPSLPDVPKSTGSDFHSAGYKAGSGDSIQMSTLPMSLEIAAQTIGFELVPVVPSNGPWTMLSYMDFPYAGGKLGRVNETALDGKGAQNENKPIYIKFNVDLSVAERAKVKAAGTVVDGVKVGDGAKKVFTGTFLGFSRIDGAVIVKVTSAKDDAKDDSIYSVFKSATSIVLPGEVSKTVAAGAVNAELVAAAADHVQGFTNFFDGDKEPMSRAENETGTGNTIGARMFTKIVQMGSYEVTGTVTRQQLQDMPQYGIDVVGKVLEAMQNEISQSINNRILDRIFKLGVENAVNQNKIQGINLNLYLGDGTVAEKKLSDFPAAHKFLGIDGTEKASKFATPIHTAIQNTAAENVTTHQRRIMSRVLAAANVITNVSRFGRANFVVTNTRLITALQDASSFIMAPMENTLSQSGENSLYFAGSLAGLNVYVDPYMQWDDMRIVVGRKSDGEKPGVVFMPYILADQVQVTAEGTMAPKLLINSRFAIVDCGFHPEQQYLTFMVDAMDSYLL